MKNIIINIMLISVLWLFISYSASSQQDEQASKPILQTGTVKEIFSGIPSQLKTKCDSFFEILLKSGVEKGFKDLLEGSPIGEKSEQVDNLVAQTKKANTLYGMIKGYEPINSEIASSSLIRLRYLGLHPNSPTRWIFTFYKSPTRNWILINIKFDDLSEFLFSDE